MHTNHPATSTRKRLMLLAGLTALGALQTANASASPQPVLMVIANQDFYYKEYAATRSALQALGLPVVVAAGKAGTALPQAAGGGLAVRADVAIAQVSADDYSAIVFVGGWGSSMYQYAFAGTYANAAYNGQVSSAREANRLINEFLAADKPVAGLCHGVTVLAWARVNGVSPLRGRAVVGAVGGMPGFRSGGFDFRDAEYPARWQIEANGALMLTSGSIGNPMTVADDVIVDGRIITGENFDSAVRFAEEIAKSIASSAQ